jgi:hypothetical protein
MPLTWSSNNLTRIFANVEEKEEKQTKTECEEDKHPIISNTPIYILY